MKKISIIFVLGFWFFSAEAFAFKAFSKVNNVCATCVQEKAHEIDLKDGVTIRTIVDGENPNAYVVSRYSELRWLRRDEIKSIKWAKGSKPAKLVGPDTLLLKNGIAFAGKIIANKAKPALIQIKSATNGFTYSLFESQIEEIYQNGERI